MQSGSQSGSGREHGVLARAELTDHQSDDGDGGGVLLPPLHQLQQALLG